MGDGIPLEKQAVPCTQFQTGAGGRIYGFPVHKNLLHQNQGEVVVRDGQFEHAWTQAF